MKSTYHTYTCLNLTIFSYKANTTTGNETYVIYLKLGWFCLWNYFKQTYLWWILSHLKPVCHRAEGGISSWIGAGLGLVQLYSNVLVLGMEKLGGCWGLVSPVVCSMYEYSAQWKPPPPQPPRSGTSPPPFPPPPPSTSHLLAFTQEIELIHLVQKILSLVSKALKGCLISKSFHFE